MSLPLTARGFGRAVSALVARDGDLAAIVARHGRPQFWHREPGFATLVLVILEQQVSLASARAAYDRLLARVGGRLDPDRLLGLSDEALRTAGCSRQKTRYCRALAAAVKSGDLPLDALDGMPDGEARARLETVVGIGRWTADVYLLAALRRPDVWPVGDLALVAALQRVKGLAERPTPAAMTRAGEYWRPWRSVAARLLWHEYLSR
jgi:DNA-3-methyladenine glycosylase II